MPELSVIIVTYNSEDFIRECLESLYKNLGQIEAEVIVVDNASTDKTVSLVEEKFPQVKLIKNEANVGFGRGHNLGIKSSLGKYKLLLNPDVFLTNDLSAVFKYLQSEPKIGILGVKLLFPSREVQPYIAGWQYTLADLLVSHLGVGKQAWKSKVPLQVDWVTGAFFLFRQELYQTLADFDEKFFLYFEDQDYCLRAKKAGWQVVYYPGYEALHYHGASSDASDSYLARHYYASEDYFFAKYRPRWEQIARTILVAPIVRLRTRS
ncbi:MAG: glycosyltransferase family 2 protein [bacterium]|nr:glycosyltransferase family 2 protein [bacterium]